MCVCVCRGLGPVFVLLLLHCCATSASSNTSSPTGFTQGICNLSNKALFVCMCVCMCGVGAHEKQIETRTEGGIGLPYKGFTDAFLLENEASGKSDEYVALCVCFLPLVFLKTSVLCRNTHAQRMQLRPRRCYGEACWKTTRRVCLCAFFLLLIAVSVDKE